jgi:hypothetical protein
MFISVDFPAPFSPSSACTSPRFTSSATSSLATTPGNSLRIPRISRTSPSLTAPMLSRNSGGREPAPPSVVRVRYFPSVAGGLSLPEMIWDL